MKKNKKKTYSFAKIKCSAIKSKPTTIIISLTVSVVVVVVDNDDDDDDDGFVVECYGFGCSCMFSIHFLIQIRYTNKLKLG